jgi:hypothetical protein
MAKFYNSRGEVVDAADDICPPGCHVRAGVMLLDGVQQQIARQRLVDAFGETANVGHRPGHVYDAAADERRDRAYDQMCQRLCDSWRGPAAAAAPEPPTQSRTDTRDARDFAYDAMVQKISSAWRGGGR